MLPYNVVQYYTSTVDVEEVRANATGLELIVLEDSAAEVEVVGHAHDLLMQHHERGGCCRSEGVHMVWWLVMHAACGMYYHVILHCIWRVTN